MPRAVPGPAGPVKRLRFGSISVPIYMLEFDKRGACQGPRTYQALLDDLRQGLFTHVFVCSHGWNTTHSAALTRYEDFATGFHALRETRGLRVPDPYRPVMVGVSWPSIGLLVPGEKPPRMAAGFVAPAPDASAVAEVEDDAEEQVIAELSAAMPAGRAGRFAELAARESLGPQGAAELAGLLASICPVAGDELGDDAPAVTAEAVMRVWGDLLQAGFGAGDGQRVGPESFHAPPEDLPAGTSSVESGSGHGEDEPRAAGIANRIAAAGARLDPRPILRAVTVRTMKDRAGVVGAAGVGPLLTDLLTAAGQAASVHLIGHSYGCRLLLAALSTGGVPRPVDSLLLLQPAVNYLCFATQVPKTGLPGGFRPALEHIRQPVLSTFSANDDALHDFFHWALRRRSDLGEPLMALLGQVPSLYCALGGWGPGGMADGEAGEIGLAACPDRYDLSTATVRVYAVRGDTGIRSHSDVVNDFTFWALYNQVTG